MLALTLLIALVPLALVGLTLVNNAENALTQESISKLDAVASITKNRITDEIARHRQYHAQEPLVDHVREIMGDYTGLGQTGEVTLAEKNANGDAVYIIKRRFEKEISIATISKEETNVPIIKAINGEEKIITYDVDYRGEPVLAATRYINETSWGLVAKIDKTEVYAPTEKLKSLLALTLTIITLLIAVFSFIVARTLTKPIKKLSKTVDEITSGKLETKIDSELKNEEDEIGDLAKSIDRALISLKLAVLRTGLTKEEFGLGKAIEEKKKAESDLAESRERYRVLYESSADAIMTLAPPDWKFTAGNPAAIKMFGAADEDEFKTLGPWNVSPEKQPDGSPSAEKAKKMIERAMRDGSAFFEWTHKKLRGEPFRATVLLTRVKLEGKEFLQATVRELKGEKLEKELEKSEERYRNLFDNARDGIVLLDLKAKIMDVNKRIEDYGYKKEDLIGKNQLVYIPKRYWPQIARDNLKTARGQPSEGKTELITPNGNVLVEYHTSPIVENGRVIGGQVILRDVTERKTGGEKQKTSASKTKKAEWSAKQARS